MYTATSASTISQGMSLWVCCTAPALPSKLACTSRGRLIGSSAAITASRAGPISAPGARLKEKVVAANWPSWFTDSGARLGS
ncbi:hypothetical protein D9M71_708550 [compost metagenome]